MWLVRICVVMLYPGICLDLYGVWCAQVPNSWNCTLTRKSCHKAIAAARYSVRILLLCPTCSNIIDDVAGGHWEQSCMKCSLATPPSTPMNLCQLVARWGIFFVPHWMSLLYSSTASWELECCSDFLWLWHRVAPWWRRVFSPLVMALDNVLFLHSRFYCEGSCSILNHCQ